VAAVTRLCDEHERRAGRRLTITRKRSVASDDRETSPLEHAAELALAVDA
jgi:hypothetical protein